MLLLKVYSHTYAVIVRYRGSSINGLPLVIRIAMQIKVEIDGLSAADVALATLIFWNA